MEPFKHYMIPDLFERIRAAGSEPMGTKYIVSEDKGEIAEIICDDIGLYSRWHIIIDNYPAQRKTFSTSLPIITVEEFVKDMARVGLILQRKKLTLHIETLDGVDCSFPDVVPLMMVNSSLPIAHALIKKLGEVFVAELDVPIPLRKLKDNQLMLGASGIVNYDEATPQMRVHNFTVHTKPSIPTTN